MSKFTKGQWEAMSDGTIVILNRRGEPGEIVASADSIERDEDEVFANARLIAAAPEMYRILMMLVIGSIRGSGGHKVTQKVADEIDALLAHIDGEEVKHE